MYTHIRRLPLSYLIHPSTHTNPYHHVHTYLSGDRLVPGAVRRVVSLLRADMDGDLEGRLRGGWWLLLCVAHVLVVIAWVGGWWIGVFFSSWMHATITTAPFPNP